MANFSKIILAFVCLLVNALPIKLQVSSLSGKFTLLTLQKQSALVVNLLKLISVYQMSQRQEQQSQQKFHSLITQMKSLMLTLEISMFILHFLLDPLQIKLSQFCLDKLDSNLSQSLWMMQSIMEKLKSMLMHSLQEEI